MLIAKTLPVLQLSKLLQKNGKPVRRCVMSLLHTHKPEAMAMQRWLRFHAPPLSA
jgi:hypothetical protein